ncbi:hypothetical protein HK096_003173, partial [Nowakowskiella sp. JEL0078]
MEGIAFNPFEKDEEYVFDPESTVYQEIVSLEDNTICLFMEHMFNLTDEVSKASLVDIKSIKEIKK